jgi:DNA-directed RNA polymerase subunit RPC12/RpoP
MGSVAASVEVKPLLCSNCGGAVPLADADAVACPYCSHTVQVPESLRALRRGLATLTEERRAAEGLYRRIGKPPPRFLRAFLLFESVWFWMLGAGFWLVLSIVVFTFAVPASCALVLRINTWDVLNDSQESALSIGLTLGTVVLGLLLAGWSRKRVIALGGLQAALAATPPSAPGGPSRCRRCAAALVVLPGALGARCDYCRADNLVEIPAEWVQRTSRIARKVALEEDAAIRAEAEARRELRTSLILRLVIGGTLALAPAIGIWNAPPRDVDFDAVDVFGAPSFLPSWTTDHLPTWRCEESSFYSSRRASHCREGRCTAAFLVALRHGRPYRLFVQDAPPSSEVVLERRQMGFFDARWEPVAREPASAAGSTFMPPLTAWYRVRITTAEEGALQTCDRQD